MTQWIRGFAQLSKADASIAGGKGASLGEMTQAGIPVPPGFVILSDSFEEFLSASGLHSQIDTILAGVNPDAVHTIDSASEQIKALILNAPIPSQIESVIVSDFDRLGAQFVAVRSSATAEDGASHAWAGQLESYLNTTSATLLENVKRCWASLFTPRAIFYRLEKGLQSTKISVAVVVQKMVQSEVSGIAFSVHPVTQDYNQMIIEAGYGLGEAIVSGQITPDSYVLAKDTVALIEKNVSAQERGMFKTASGGSEWLPIDPVQQELQKLSDPQVLELGRLILRIEKHYGFPCDIEWAFENGKFYIVQSRPITTLETPADGTLSQDNKDNNLRKSGPDEREYTDLDYLDPRDFVFSFESKGTQFIFEDLVAQYYTIAHTITFTQQSTKYDYKTKELLSQMRARGRDVSVDEINEYITQINKSIKAAIKKAAELDSRISAADARTAIAILGEVSKNYLAFDNAYFDDTYELSFKNPDAKKVIELVQTEKNKLRSELEPVFFTQGSLLQKLLRLVSQKTGIAVSILEWYRTAELAVALEGLPVADEEIAARKIATAHIKGNELRFISGEKAATLLKRFLILPAGTSVSGLTANGQGKIIEGKARIIVRDYMNPAMTELDMDAMDEGDILISQTTDPALMKALRKASAIVTDVGGMLSHAAISARELGIPCIVNTLYASKIFKNGQMLRVDAGKGTVEGTVELTGRRMVNLQSRQRSIAYFHVWQQANQPLTRHWYKPVSHILFVNDSERVKTKAWYIESELSAIFDAAGHAANDDPVFFSKLCSEYKQLTEELIPYCEGRKKISSKQDWQWFLNKWIEWWAPMAIIFVLPESQTAKPVVRKKALELRTWSEKYSDVCSRLAVEYVCRVYPAFADVAQVLTVQEIDRLPKLSAQEIATIRERKKGFVLHNANVYPRNQLDKILAQNNLVLDELAVPQSDHVKGQSACPGKVRGKAVIVLGREDLTRATAGSILVTEMTSPEYLPFVKSAAAIVTNEGGVNCHASIVARELGKPAVIGTLFATKLFKEGDLLEVDATDGIVRRISPESKHACAVDAQDAAQFVQQLIDSPSDWVEQGRWVQPPFVYTFFSHWHRTAAVKQILPLQFHTTFSLDGHAFQLKDDRQAIVDYLVKLHHADGLESVARRMDAGGKSAIASVQALLAKGPDYVKAHVDEFIQAYTEFAGFWCVAVYVGDQITTMAKQTGYVHSEADLFAKVHPYLRESWIEDEMRTMVQIAQSVLAANPRVKTGELTDSDLDAKTRAALEKYVTKFAWVRMSKWMGDAIDLRYALDRLREEIENCRNKSHVSINRSSDAPDGVVALSACTAYWRAECGKTEMQTALALRQLFVDLAAAHSLSYDKALLLVPAEFASAIKQGYIPNLHSALAREKEFFSTADESEIILTPQDSQYAAIKAVMLKPAEQSDVLHGVGAMPGKITGTVRIINSAKQFDTFKKGEILVAPETTPSYVPLMRIASAILTAKGGITSHAAIVSRELGKPCIIAIPNVTRILKDGDIVEVDATSGVVRHQNYSGTTQTAPALKKSDYIRLMRFSNVPVLLDFCYLRSKTKYGIIAITQNRVRSAYFPKKEFERSLRDGAAFFEGSRSTDFEKEIYARGKSFVDITHTLSAKKEFTYADFCAFADAFTRFYELYDLTDFWTTDGCVHVIQERMPQFGKLKENLRRDVINAVLLGENGYCYCFISRLAAFLHLDNQTLLYLTPHELEQVFAGKPAPNVAHRVERSAILTVANDGDDLAYFDDEKLFREFSDDTKETTLHGVTAHPGVVRGKVVVFPDDIQSLKKLAQAFSRMQRGDILVAETTSPEIMPACSMAGAIVTNQGGLLSHAAIVSRELHIPCIVGTDRATRIFMDGDIVEVDATAGVVKLISPHSGAATDLTLHFRVTDIPMCVTDLQFRAECYGRLDYRVVQIRDEVRAYLTAAGVAQARDLGSQLFDDVFFEQSVKQLEAIRAQLANYTQENSNASQRWHKLRTIICGLCKQYLLCEQPVVAPLEEEYLRRTKDVPHNLQLLHDADLLARSTLDADAKSIAHKLRTLGELKLSIHQHYEPLFVDLMDVLTQLGEKHDVDIFSLTCAEIDLLLSGKTIDKSTKSIISQRSQGVLLYAPTDTLLIQTGAAFEQFVNALTKSKNIKGVCANPGQARGIVKMHLATVSRTTIPKGSVFVTGMTNPLLASELRHAAAIVTDEGGLTSHAAIFAREFGIPCIVGTGNATQVLRDGDVVEVDAAAGIVKKADNSKKYKI